MNVRYKLQVMSLEFRGGSYRTGVGLGLDKAEKVQRMEQAGSDSDGRLISALLISVYGKAEKVIDVALIVDDGTGWIRKWFCVLTEKFSSSYTRLSIRTPLRLTTSGNVNGWTEVQVTLNS
ncbi:hypothetical protein D5086_014095 [Populus alba]|uniref:Uncharacterized protein n=1 Tax=Populus alba TaxID=43335 RepID=A0ACC4C7M7_POPAL